MATYQDVQNATNSIIAAGDEFAKKRNETQQNLRQQYGYEDRVKALENAKRSVFQTNKLLRDLPTDVKRRTAGRLITNSQLNRVTAAEQAPLARQAADLESAAGEEERGLSQIGKYISDALNEDQFNYENKLRALGLQKEDTLREYQMEEARQAERRSAQLQRDLASLASAGYGGGGEGGDAGIDLGGGDPAIEVEEGYTLRDPQIDAFLNKTFPNTAIGKTAKKLQLKVKAGTKLPLDQLNANRATKGYRPITQQEYEQNYLAGKGTI